MTSMVMERENRQKQLAVLRIKYHRSECKLWIAKTLQYNRLQEMHNIRQTTRKCT